MPSFDFVKDNCAVGSAVLGKICYKLRSTQSRMLFHVKAREKQFSEVTESAARVLDGVCNVAGCIYYSRKRVSDYWAEIHKYYEE